MKTKKKIGIYIDGKLIANTSSHQLEFNKKLMNKPPPTRGELGLSNEAFYQLYYTTRRGDVGYFKNKIGTFKILLKEGYETGKRGAHHTLHLFNGKATLTNYDNQIHPKDRQDRS